MADGQPALEELKTESPVSLFACYDKVYVWDADDVFKLRSKHRIVGSLIGSLPRKPRQNIAFSLPLLLSQDEATLLLDKGYAKIFDVPKNIPTPSSEEVEKFNELRQDSIVKQIEQFQRMQEEKRRELAEVIEEGRRRKRERAVVEATEAIKESNNELEEERETKERNDLDQLNVVSNETDNVKAKKERKKEAKRKCKTGTDEEEGVLSKKLKSEEWNDEAFFQHSEDGETRKMEDCRQSNVSYNKSCDISMIENKEETCSTTASLQGTEVNLSSTNTELQTENSFSEKTEIPSLSTDSEVNIEELNTYSELRTLVHIPTAMPQRLQFLPPANWTYPETDGEKLRYRVFLDLWERGYYLTSGVNFGGDFLAYPGDPMRYHSFYIVIIVPWGKRITPFEMISAGRLGASVKKTALLCSVNGDTDQIVYTSVKWSGIS